MKQLSAMLLIVTANILNAANLGQVPLPLFNLVALTLSTQRPAEKLINKKEKQLLPSCSFPAQKNTKIKQGKFRRSHR